MPTVNRMDKYIVVYLHKTYYTATRMNKIQLYCDNND